MHYPFATTLDLIRMISDYVRGKGKGKRRKGVKKHMAHLFQVIITQTVTNERIVNVIAETPEEAQGKVTIAEGETIVNTEDNGEVIQ